MDYGQELRVAREIAAEAGKAIMEIYGTGDDWGGGLEVEYKEGNMPLTEADKAANKIITDRLRKEFPDYAVLSEEEEDHRERLGNPNCFIVDPLDGTKEFIKRNGQFTVNIALAYRQESVMGVIYVPVTGELYYAARGTGAYLEKEGSSQRIYVSQCKSDIRAVMSSSHGCEEMERLIEKYKIRRLVRMGSSLKGCLVARGDAEVYYRHNPTMEWDTAAMQCIVEEARGIFRQMDGSPMTYNREDCTNRNGFYILNHIDNTLTMDEEETREWII